MARYNRLQGSGPDRTQNSTQDGLDSLERSALGPASRNGAPQSSNGKQTARRSVPVNQPTLIPHGLGRPFRGWTVAQKSAGQSFYTPAGTPYDKRTCILVEWTGDPADPPIDVEFWVY